MSTEGMFVFEKKEMPFQHLPFIDPNSIASYCGLGVGDGTGGAVVFG
jgi:hypothetical protein